MKVGIKIVLGFILLSSVSLFGQDKKGGVYDRFKVLPAEKVYVSMNTNVLLTGEYLFYKVYCINDKTKQPSDNSQIAYIDLVDENYQLVFSHKIRLENSQGQGDYFVPTSVPSGNYKLVAYTRWMKNGRKELFFQEDVSIINPYQTDQDTILKVASNSTEVTNNMIKTQEYIEDKRFVLVTDKENYPKQSKVQLKVKNFRGASGYGDYNISIRKRETLENAGKYTPEAYLKLHKALANNTIFYDEITYGPEIEGELLKGRLVAIDDKRSVIGKKIGLSIPGKDYQLKVVGTDSSGVFHVSINKDYTEAVAIIQVLDEPKNAYSIVMEQDQKIDYSFLKFKEFYINAAMEDAIVSRSVKNQIENGFYEVKPDTVRLDLLNDPYGGAYIETVNLDEYTRFKTLEETVVELVPNVWTKKNKDGVSVFKVRSFDETYEESEFDAIVYIDGVLIPNPNEILDFDTRTVAKINTVREKYRLGGQTYFGMVNIETINGDYFNNIRNADAIKVNLVRTKPNKRYFKQAYTATSDSRIPDFRDQLLWQPNFKFEGTEMELSFFTSQVSGDYEILLEGFSIYGRPVTVKQFFKVE